jgi:hypothetical protein
MVMRAGIVIATHNEGAGPAWTIEPRIETTLDAGCEVADADDTPRDGPVDEADPRFPIVTPAVATIQARPWQNDPSHAFRVVNSLGGINFLNIWTPAIGANQVFSLSPYWYSGLTAGQKPPGCYTADAH